MNKDRIYRRFQLDEAKPNYILEGYAALFEPYPLREIGQNTIFEHIKPTAFKNADMSDIVLRIDHEGSVYARVSNKTLQVNVDNKGLFFRADLSTTEKSKQVWEEVDKGLIKDMSWAFTIDDNGELFDERSNTIFIEKVKKVYDVSLVNLNPANKKAYVEARSLEGALERYNEEQELLSLRKSYLETLERVKKNVW